MDEHAATTRISRVDEAIASFEVLFKVRRLRIRLTDPLVGVLLGELGVKSSSDGQDVGDARSRQDVLVVGCHVVPNEKPLNHFIQRFNPILLIEHHHVMLCFYLFIILIIDIFLIY